MSYRRTGKQESNENLKDVDIDKHSLQQITQIKRYFSGSSKNNDKSKKPRKGSKEFPEELDQLDVFDYSTEYERVAAKMHDAYILLFHKSSALENRGIK